MYDISTVCVQIMYRELKKKFDSELPDNYDELIRYFLKEEKETQSELEKKELNTIVNVMKLVKYFDDIRNSDENNIMDFEDMKIFNKENEQRIEIQILLSKKIYPLMYFRKKRKVKKNY